MSPSPGVRLQEPRQPQLCLAAAPVPEAGGSLLKSAFIYPETVLNSDEVPS